MDSQPTTPSTPNWMYWTGWALTALSALALIASATFKFIKPGYKPEGAPDVGWDEGLVFTLGFVELGCALIYLFPRTSVFGAILLTGYLGGAVATHVRIHDPFAAPIILGVLVWLGIYLRCGQLRAIVFWR